MTTEQTIARRCARGAHWGLDQQLLERLAALDTPEAVQDFVTAIPMNFADGTSWSVQEVLRRNVAMCIEGAFVAAAALHLQGHPPLIMRMFASDGDDHVVVPFLRDGCWGAISKSNHVWLRWRDPVYRTVRELMMSYLHEYLTGSDKTLRGYCDPFDLRRLPPSDWITHADSCREVGIKLWEWGYSPLFDPQAATLRLRDATEVLGHQIVEYQLR